jgi:predicted nucleic acid-binding protein
MDLLIAATAQMEKVPLISFDEDLRALADVIDLRNGA